MKSAAVMLALTLISASASAQDAAVPAAPAVGPRPALIATKATQARLMDIVATENHLIAVGEEGVILTSPDGVNWTQSPSPVNTMLTRVRFTSAQQGWVLGYDSTILHTADGGKTWALRHYDPKGRGLYDILFTDARNGFAVGAFGHVYATADGGNTWTESASPISKPGVHLNMLLKLQDGSLFVAGERGFMARSRDNGANWQALNSPYAGSFFGARVLGDKGVLVYGMRGNVFLTADIGRAATMDIAHWDPDARQSVTDAGRIAALGWRRVDSDSHESLFGDLLLKDRTLLLLGVNGTALKLDTAKATLRAVKTSAVETLTHAVLHNGHIIAVGRRGVQDLGVSP